LYAGSLNLNASSLNLHFLRKILFYLTLSTIRPSDLFCFQRNCEVIHFEYLVAFLTWGIGPSQHLCVQSTQDERGHTFHALSENSNPWS